ncbi:MAG: PTS sugar transporter subunit IIA [Phycisphaerales bacterium]|nr:PTS sugar transporter subunit IIA [Phycisphaerae bacterium]NNF42520.1 PTS sugar transporter subunit IIA [Phycisphaerales bacterium]NNM26526.1 PTS sugar transporter subunit IIA [Phycisphaerales bacterium]
MKLLEFLSPDAIKVPLDAEEKHSAIDELVDLLAECGLISDATRLKEVVWEREQQRSTGIGEGLAIPHGKSECSADLVLAVGRPKSPIEFGSVDKKPVRLIVLLASPPDKTAEHIQALSKISRLMIDPDFRESVYTAETAEAIYGLFERGCQD